MGRKIKDITGQTFGIFTVIKQSDEKYITESGIEIIQWDCIDKDGNEYKLLYQYLKNNPMEYKPYKKHYRDERPPTKDLKIQFVRNKQAEWYEKERREKRKKAHDKNKTLTTEQRTSENWIETDDGINHNQKKYDFTGQIIGNWRVLEETIPYQNKTIKYTRRKWLCQCINKLPDGTECGNLSDVLESNLLDGGSNGCSKCAARETAIKINIGEVYGKLKVLEIVDEYLYDDDTLDKNKKYLCECQCKLKTKVIKTGQYLTHSKKLCCRKLRCDESIAVVDDNGEIIKRQCVRCGKLQDANMFKTKNAIVSNPVCLECEPRKVTQLMKFRVSTGLKGRYNYYKTKHNTKKYSFELTLDEFDYITQQECFYCGGYSHEGLNGDGPLKVKGGINLCGIDRIDSSKGYNKHNVVPCCNICNTMKMSRDIYEWLRCIKRIYENNSGKTEEWDKWIGRVEKEINEIVNGGGYQFGKIGEDGISVKKK